MADHSAKKVLIAEDDQFTRGLVREVLAGAGHEVDEAATVSGALARIAEKDYHVVVSDLSFGDGPTGIDLLRRLHERQPWVGMVVLSTHASPALVGGRAGKLPESVIYLVKSELGSPRALLRSVDLAIEEHEHLRLRPAATDAPERARVTMTQAEVLGMLARGFSVSKIAQARGTSMRAAEKLVHRLYESLGVAGSADVDPRIAAVLMWQQGRVVTGPDAA
ncbi:DNA-binding NarL/FixJ family response regulator [Microbacterium endophyticum]|uniref:DNA-binding NarL/FixJ family response regulator n=1 Tax=Microbacterium endophyticum TaxID=1526412 RepID=A0A7W4V3X9_9MICO|nr:response regulator [Microbacterium endophyticum]MBB2976426.1 DNA-binding NarL/FixJ family response regulator [Microbacterium endophyticum]NIK35872.1 DNA-binding NarL/FixJ family response regulator [Microbacterium endophyticum]